MSPAAQPSQHAVQLPHARADGASTVEAAVFTATIGTTTVAAMPQHFLYLRPLPQGQGSLRPVPGNRGVLIEYVSGMLEAAIIRHGPGARCSSVASFLDTELRSKKAVIALTLCGSRVSKPFV